MRKLAIAAAVSLSLSSASHALGLGEIEMYSALNQTLDAEIAILSATESELQNMQVGLAPAGAFARAGLVQSPVLSSVSFAVDRRPDGKAVVKVTSDGPVLEPFLNFLIEVDAPGSVKLIREYTVLLNPATFASTSGTEQSDTFSADQIFANNASEGAGVAIDLSDSIGVTAAAETVANTFEGNDTGSEVVFTETSLGSFTVPAADASDAAGDAIADQTLSAGNLFVPDDEVFTNAGSATSVVDSGGQVISLEQELNTTPQFEDSGVISSGSLASVGDGEAVALDNLGAQSESADNAIFDSEFDADGGDLIAGDELRELVGDVATTSDPVVEFTETSAIEPFVSDASSDIDLATEDLFESDNVVANIADSDAEGGAGALIDLSGIFDDTGSSGQEDATPVVVDTEEVSQPAAPTQNVEVSGNTYRIQSQDTLWRIANSQKARGVTPHQMMVALLDANPNAFVSGNMNRMRNGAVLQIPTVAMQNAVEPANALAIVQSWTRDNRPPTRISTGTVANVVEPVIVTNDSDITISTAELNQNLDEVNERYEQVRTEIATDSLERDELQGRVNNLTDNMEEMKSMITVRESELSQLQAEVTAAENSAAAIDAQINELSDASEGVASMQKDLNVDLAEVQDAIERQADVEKNLATAEAEAQSVRLSSEENALRAQLAALEIEKRELEASAQSEKAALVRESEAEKTQLLAQAKAEREKIMAELEVEKARISDEATAEIMRIKGEAASENQRLQSEAQADRDRLAAETEQMQVKIKEMEAEKARLLAEADAKSAELKAEADKQARLTAEAEAETERLKQEAEAKMAEVSTMTDTGDTDAEGMVDNTVSNISDAGKDMAAGGAAAIGGLLGFAPLQEMIGNRKNVLAAGAGLSLLGLLGAWGMRRRKTAEPKTVEGIRPRAENRPMPAGERASYAQEEAMYGDDQKRSAQQRTNNSGAAAAAAAAAAVGGTAVVATQRDANAAAPAATDAKPPQASATTTQTAASTESTVDIEETALDDTITEAEVYLRYGLHGQAEDLLKTAIDRSPDNEEYHFKLLENYHDQKNPGDFKVAAATFTEKFPNSAHASRVAEMSSDLESAGGPGLAAAGAGVAAAAAGAIASGKDALADGSDAAMESDAEDLLDQTIDPGTEFSVDELQATGNVNAAIDDAADFGDQGGLSLDDVDLASLDDDGTLNLEEVAGAQMSGGDIGSLDLTNPDLDNTLDNLTLDDADLNSLGNVGGDIRQGLEADLPVENTIAGGTDEMETMLDLAKAYIDMGDNANATKTLKDIAARGNPLQQAEASELLKKLT